jgi:site-specific DNA-methyltransferase (adenine-specific)
MSRLNIQKNTSGKYYLKEISSETRETIVKYGEEKPIFKRPDMNLGFCEDLITNQASKSVDLIVDDPPYGTTNTSWDKEPDWTRLVDEYRRVLKDDGLIVIFGKTKSLVPVYNTFTDSGLDFRFELIWRKQNNAWKSDKMPISVHENIHVFQKSETKASELTFNTEKIRREAAYICPSCEEKKTRGSWKKTREHGGPGTQKVYEDDAYQSSGGEDRYPVSHLNPDVLNFTSVTGSHDEYLGYSAQKPTDLLMWIVKAMTNRGDTVLDPHAGSGSTAAACIPLCRETVGYEVRPDRYKTARNRVDDILGQFRGYKHVEINDEVNTDSAPDVAPADD